MKCNVGNADRAVRLILGIVILAGGLIFRSWWGLIGLIPLITGIVSWCPLYVPLKINTGAKADR
jgi:hypothetical protein